MAVDSKSPEIFALRKKVEEAFKANPVTHSNFQSLSNEIFQATKEHLSVSTLERIWNYSNYGYETVSLRTLDVICRYIGFDSWNAFLKSLEDAREDESDIFDCETVESAELEPGNLLRIGWQPNRVCTLRYLGNNRYQAESTVNSTLQPGDTFSCLSFQIHSPLYVDDLRDEKGAIKGVRYGMGLRHGLTLLQKL